MFKVDKEKCVGCAACVSVCPVGAISMDEDKAVISSQCVDCGSCVQVCPQNAISPGTTSENTSSNQKQISGDSSGGSGIPGSGNRGIGRGLGRGMGRGLGRGPRDGRGQGRGGGGRR